MKSLIVEDEFTTRLILQNILSQFGEVHIAVNGREATEAVRLAYRDSAPYRLIAMDVMMPEMNGQAALKAIRTLEHELAIDPAEVAKIIMTTALGDGKTIMTAFKDQCDGYLVKPIDKAKLLKYLDDFKLI
ncbi:MAG: response regulator [Geoalkalibacter sp.]|jgi:two-component system chemotaxis response regulator CheY|uniref:response regulator n=1 Tax=Geoalkalibacter sp. TaxID=3041440 RepID=UPI003D11AA38